MRSAMDARFPLQFGKPIGIKISAEATREGNLGRHIDEMNASEKDINRSRRTFSYPEGLEKYGTAHQTRQGPNQLAPESDLSLYT